MNIGGIGGGFDQVEQTMKPEAKFENLPINEQAVKDFRYLCSNVGLNPSNDVAYQLVRDMKTGNDVGRFFVFGSNTEDKIAKFPKKFIDGRDDVDVAVVAYKNKHVGDVFLFSGEDFKKAGGMFNILKKLDKENAYGIDISNLENKKLKEHTFGVMISK